MTSLVFNRRSQIRVQLAFVSVFANRSVSGPYLKVW